MLCSDATLNETDMQVVRCSSLSGEWLVLGRLIGRQFSLKELTRCCTSGRKAKEEDE